MEVRARYVRMGTFTLAVILLSFGFVYWLNNSASFGDRIAYRVEFEGPVSGLLRGSAVLFNGIRVGEVTELALDPARPRNVLATIAIARSTPVRRDTEISIDFQGLMGSPVITLTGGSGAGTPLGAKGAPPVLKARADAGQTMSMSARDVLRRLGDILEENAQPLRSMLANIDAFSGALARNSDKVDGIVAGLERMTGGATAKARANTFSLRPLRVTESRERAPGVQLIVPEPSALMSLDSERIAIVSSEGVLSALPDGQWTDAVTRIVQASIIRGLEDSRAFGGVSRPLEDLSSDFRLSIDVRKFQVAASKLVEIELGGKIIDNKGRIVATHVVQSSAPVKGDDAAGAVSGFDQAMSKLGPEFIAWVAQTISRHAASTPGEAKKGN